MDINSFKEHIHKPAATKPNPNLDKDKKTEQSKSNYKGKLIRLSDYQILREYSFYNDTTVQNAVAIALEKLIKKLETEMDFKIPAVSDVNKDKKNIRLSKESMDQLKEIHFKQGASMMDVISAAVKLLD